MPLGCADWKRHSVFFMFIFRLNSSAVLVKLITNDCISGALCATSALSSANSNSLARCSVVWVLALKKDTLNRSPFFSSVCTHLLGYF